MATTLLYAEIEPFKTEQFRVSETHVLYLEQSGNVEGNPVIFVHGGPGGGCSPKDRRRFDPEAYWIISFEAGKSTPPSCLEDNTTWDLVEDMEKIRSHLQIERWVVFGCTRRSGSWGSTLSLAYAQSHATRVKALVLRGIFTLRRKELEFFYQGPGSNFLFPDYWEDYVSVIPESERSDMMWAYYKRLTSLDTAVRQRAATAWSMWEAVTSRLHVDPKYIEDANNDAHADRFARIECHYFVNRGWMRDGQLLEQGEIDKIRHIPAVIVQGRYDAVCPATTAWELHKMWPEADFHMVADAGHSALESATEALLVDATNRFRATA